MDRYRRYASPDAQVHWQGEQLMSADHGAVLAEDLATAWGRAGVDALNLRVHVPGVPPAAARDQIAALGDVVTTLHSWNDSKKRRNSSS